MKILKRIAIRICTIVGMAGITGVLITGIDKVFPEKNLIPNQVEETEITETEFVETEATEIETEAAETETTEVETEAAETEATEIETEAAETETTEVETEAAETEATEIETEAAETEATEIETEAAETEVAETETEIAETETETEVAETEAVVEFPGTSYVGATTGADRIRLQVAFDEEEQITTIQILKITEEEKDAAQEFINTILEAKSTDVDNVEGSEELCGKIRSIIDGCAKIHMSRLAADVDVMEIETETETEVITEIETKTETELITEIETDTETETETETEVSIFPLEYTATAVGYDEGEVTVTVVIGPDQKIEDVRIDDVSSQGMLIGQVAAPEVALRIVEAQSPEVDAVTGATYTSNAIKEAVATALEQVRVEL